jgi:hypothetical protein
VANVLQQTEMGAAYHGRHGAHCRPGRQSLSTGKATLASAVFEYPATRRTGFATCAALTGPAGEFPLHPPIRNMADVATHLVLDEGITEKLPEGTTLRFCSGGTEAVRRKASADLRRPCGLTHAAEHEGALDLNRWPSAPILFARRRPAFSSESSVGAADILVLATPNPTNLTLRKLWLDREPDVRKSEVGVWKCTSRARALAEIYVRVLAKTGAGRLSPIPTMAGEALVFIN